MTGKPEIASVERIEADYRIETTVDPEAAVDAMAGEQSSGTFLAVPGETAELKERSAARVERLEMIEFDGQPSLPGAARGDGVARRALVTLSWPLDNIGPSLPNLMATVAGNLFELKQFSGLRITDLRLPRAFADRYSGPKFGIEGTRRLSGVHDRPLIGTIIKPSIGLDVAATADLTRALCDADIDFIKDDELQSDGRVCPFDARAEAVLRHVNETAERTGRKPMFALNVTGELDEMRRRHDRTLALGGTCIMVSLNAIGLIGLIELAKHSQLPIHAHRNGWGYLSRHPMLGWSYVAWQKIWRLAGADHMHVNGLDNKFCEENESVIRSAKTCLTPIFQEKPCVAMPVFSSGQSAKQAPATFSALNSPDLIYAAGGGIMAHPDGPAAGVASLRQAWQAAMEGTSLTDFALGRPELAKALETYSA
nr:ribulose-bisphosphate carboxylase large subunit family protein [uncultured Roseibium sp.]